MPKHHPTMWQMTMSEPEVRTKNIVTNSVPLFEKTSCRFDYHCKTMQSLHYCGGRNKTKQNTESTETYIIKSKDSIFPYSRSPMTDFFCFDASFTIKGVSSVAVPFSSFSLSLVFPSASLSSPSSFDCHGNHPMIEKITPYSAIILSELCRTT